MTTQKQRITELEHLGYEHTAGVIGCTPYVILTKRTVAGRHGSRVSLTGAVTHLTTEPPWPAGKESRWPR